MNLIKITFIRNCSRPPVETYQNCLIRTQSRHLRNNNRTSHKEFSGLESGSLNYPHESRITSINRRLRSLQTRRAHANVGLVSELLVIRDRLSSTSRRTNTNARIAAPTFSRATVVGWCTW